MRCLETLDFDVQKKYGQSLINYVPSLNRAKTSPENCVYCADHIQFRISGRSTP